MQLRQALEEAKRMTIPKNHRLSFEIIDYREHPQKCYWIDTEKGIFQIEGQGGFSSIDDFQINDPQITNIQLERYNGNS